MSLLSRPRRVHQLFFRREESGGGKTNAAYRHSGQIQIADYVWLPFRFDGDMPILDWRDEWSPDDFE